MNCIKKLPWSAGKYIDTRKYYPQDRVYCDGSVYVSLVEQIGNKPSFTVNSDGTYTVSEGWMLLAPGMLDKSENMDYPSLTGKPSINGVVLEGNKTPEELGMYSKEEPDSELSETSENCVQNRVVTRAIRELQDYCFPTSLEASISPSSAEWTGNSVEVSVSFRVLRNSKPVVADTVQIQFNGETKTLEKVAEGTEKFVLSAQGHKSGSVTAKKDSTAIKNSPRPISVNLYLPVYYGFSKATTGNELTIASLTKGGASLNGTRTLTNDDATKYLWLCVPNTMSINKVTSSGFDVPFLAPVEASTPLGTYKCYRTQDLPGAGSMTIVIS